MQRDVRFWKTAIIFEESGAESNLIE